MSGVHELAPGWERAVQGQPKPSKYENATRKVNTSHVKRKEKERKNSQASFVFWHLMSALSHSLKVLTSGLKCFLC